MMCIPYPSSESASCESSARFQAHSEKSMVACSLYNIDSRGSKSRREASHYGTASHFGLHRSRGCLTGKWHPTHGIDQEGSVANPLPGKRHRFTMELDARLDRVTTGMWQRCRVEPPPGRSYMSVVEVSKSSNEYAQLTRTRLLETSPRENVTDEAIRGLIPHYDGTQLHSIEDQRKLEFVPVLNQSRCNHDEVSGAGLYMALNNLTGYESSTNSVSLLTSTPLCASSDPDFQAKLYEVVLHLDSVGADPVKVIGKSPASLNFNGKVFRRLIRALGQLGLRRKDIGRIINMCPKVLHLHPSKDLKPFTLFLLNEVGLHPDNLSKVVKKCPRLLVFSIDQQLRPALKFMQTLGFTRVSEVVSCNPALLSFSVGKKFLPQLMYLEGLGFSYEEAVSMVLKFPAIFNYSAKENIEPKYEYFIKEMGGEISELVNFPQFFGFSLEERIKPRYQRAIKHNICLNLSDLLRPSEVQFSIMFQRLESNLLSKGTTPTQQAGGVLANDCALENFISTACRKPEAPILVGA